MVSGSSGMPVWVKKTDKSLIYGADDDVTVAPPPPGLCSDSSMFSHNMFWVLEAKHTSDLSDTDRSVD